MKQAPSSTSVNAKEDRHFVTALARGLEVLACFRSGNKVLSNQELALRCKLPKSTVSRLTSTLVKLGYLTHDGDSGKYSLGMATLSLGVGMLAKLDIRVAARPFMQELADATQTTVSLGVRDRLSMLYVENCRSQSPLTLNLDVGARIPIVTSSMGRAYLAAASRQERNDIVERLRKLDAWSDDEILCDISKAIADHQELGCTYSFGDWQKDVNAIAVGFQVSPTQPIAVLTCGAPAFSVSGESLLNDVRPKLLEAVCKITSSMGH
ncbi:IclR family transcriptional regulator [Alcaligenaceae bacterium]|nr:IclR family transcriptional regulator [Alcaligenaceae bacterium]